MQTLNLDVGGMTCGGCTGSVERALGKVDGVSRVEVRLQPGAATVDFDPDRVTVAQIEAAITGLGFTARALPTRHPHPPSP